MLGGRGVNFEPPFGHTRIVCRGGGEAQGGDNRGVRGVVQRGGGRFDRVVRGVKLNTGEGASVGKGLVHFLSYS